MEKKTPRASQAEEKARDRKPRAEQSWYFQKSETVGLSLGIKMRR